VTGNFRMRVGDSVGHGGHGSSEACKLRPRHNRTKTFFGATVRTEYAGGLHGVIPFLPSRIDPERGRMRSKYTANKGSASVVNRTPSCARLEGCRVSLQGQTKERKRTRFSHRKNLFSWILTCCVEYLFLIPSTRASLDPRVSTCYLTVFS